MNKLLISITLLTLVGCGSSSTESTPTPAPEGIWVETYRDAVRYEEELVNNLEDMSPFMRDMPDATQPMTKDDGNSAMYMEDFMGNISHFSITWGSSESGTYRNFGLNATQYTGNYSEDMRSHGTNLIASAKHLQVWNKDYTEVMCYLGETVTCEIEGQTYVGTNIGYPPMPKYAEEIDYAFILEQYILNYFNVNY